VISSIKEYKNDPVKEQSRQLVGEMLDRTLLTFLKPNQIRVLHLPGRDGQEFKSVYGTRGIPPENVDGIERYPEAAAEARKNNPGTNIYCTDLQDFVQRASTLDYHVISIDLTGNLSASNLEVLSTIGSKLSKNTTLFHYALSARREDEIAKAVIQSRARYMRQVANYLHAMNQNSIMTLDEQRHFALTNVIANITSGTSYKQFLNVARKYMGEELNRSLALLRESFPECQTMSDEAVIAFGRDPIDELFHMTLQTRLRISLRETRLNSSRGNRFPISYGSMSISDLEDFLAKLWSGRAVHALAAVERGKYLATHNLKRYAYVSESGTPMVGDIMYIRNHQKMLAKCVELVRTFSGSPPYFKDVYAFYKFNNSLEEFMEQEGVSIPYLLNRDFLGSAAKPILRKEKAIALLKEGRVPAELVSEFRGMSIGRLKAYAAHVTMGTYGPSARRSRVTEVDDAALKELRQDIDTQITLHSVGSLGNEDALTKEDALAYLSTGISPKEIHEAYPSTKMAQLTAWQYWLNKGKYNGS
jgi:hypothetical protein